MDGFSGGIGVGVGMEREPRRDQEEGGRGLCWHWRCGRILGKLMHMVFYRAKIKIWKLFSGATASGGSTTIGWGDDLEVLAGVHGLLSSIGLLLPCRRRPVPRQLATGGSVSHQIVGGGGSA